jgi:hypothetical protein
MQSREYTQEEVKEMFLEKARSIAKYWAEQPNQSPLERTEGAIFSLPVILDGEDVDLPGFQVFPNVGEEDKEYRISNGENWFPEDCDIGGSLHEHFYKN